MKRYASARAHSAVGTTVGLDAGTDASKSDAQKRYDKAMTWLTGDDEQTGKPRIEVYVTKQEKYTKAVDTKTKAFNDALERAKSDPANKTLAQQRAAYDRWVSENTRTYRNYIQAAYMDWVIAGKKESVEYYFSIVDNDTAMARVENSKVSPLLRHLTRRFIHHNESHRKPCVMLRLWMTMARQNTPK